MVWWYWMVLGLALLAAEMTTPGGFYILFFGLSALLVGTMAGLGIVDLDWLQWLLFSVIAIGSLLVFRGPLMARMSRGHHEPGPAASATARPIECGGRQPGRGRAGQAPVLRYPHAGSD